MDITDRRGEALIEELLQYALINDLIEESDVIWARNQLMDVLDIKEPLPNCASIEYRNNIPEFASGILDKILDYSYEKGILKENTLTQRDLMGTRIMGLFVSKPSEIIKRFYEIEGQKGTEAAAYHFYCFCQKTDYIKMERIQKNLKWNFESPFGKLEITINLSKPEKDPKEIAALKNAPQSGYPKCLLCIENVGYAGRINHPARQTHRTIPFNLCGETWHFQYSPYVYYNEHCIVLNEEHVPMRLTKNTFYKLFDFLKLFPNYFIGSNADLPIVGGSILNHDHFQGGRYVFPMEKAKAEYELSCNEYPEMDVTVVHWPMPVIRLTSKNMEEMVNLASKILSAWREYSDPNRDILAYTDDATGNRISHNTITPIARRKVDGVFELDLVLRNNRVSEEHPLGIFHPHEDLHHIKKENIGLIEVMGYFILPGRLREELDSIKRFLTGQASASLDMLYDSEHALHHHVYWLEKLLYQYGSKLSEEEAQSVIDFEVGEKCLQVLTDSGVFKATPEGREGLNHFLHGLGLKIVQ